MHIKGVKWKFDLVREEEDNINLDFAKLAMQHHSIVAATTCERI